MMIMAAGQSIERKREESNEEGIEVNWCYFNTDEIKDELEISSVKFNPKPKDYISLTVSEIGKEIFSTGFYNNKAKSIK